LRCGKPQRKRLSEPSECASSARSVDAVVPQGDRFGESDLHFVTQLARMHGATVTVKAGKLIVTPRGAGKSASGKPLPAITLARSDVGHSEVSLPDRASFGAVCTKVHDARTGKKIDLVIPNPDAPPGGSLCTAHVRPARYL
jgi:phage protein D